MAVISVSFNTTATQDTKLARILALKNGQGESYADVNDMAKQELIRLFTAYMRQLDDSDTASAETAYMNAYRNSSPAVQAQIKTLLGF